jgi:hypothetical protein
MWRGWSGLDLAALPVHSEVVSLAEHVGSSLFITLERTGSRRRASVIETERSEGA